MPGIEMNTKLIENENRKQTGTWTYLSEAAVRWIQSD